MNPRRFRLIYACLAAVSSTALAHGPHVHGTAELHVAVENNGVTVEFHTPLENLLGFEHAPRNDAQRAAVKAMTAKLNKPATLFKLPKGASCTPGATRIESPLNAPASAKSDKAAQDDEDDHADLTATLVFTCASMSKLDSIEILVFSVFPGTRSIKAQIIGPRGQSAATLSPNRRSIIF